MTSGVGASFSRWVLPLALVALVWLVPALGRAEMGSGSESRPWSAAVPGVVADVVQGRPLVVNVVVPLCSNQQIDCGASWAGQAGRPKTNLYWGAIFGARRFLERKRSGYERVGLSVPETGPILEEAVYRRSFDAGAWGASGQRELVVILQAVHGARIDTALSRFWQLATSQVEVSFDYRGQRRTERLHVAGYAGHNRLMDGARLPSPDPNATTRPKGSFVLACYSDRYFSPALEATGVEPLVTTQALMAPEGYLIDSIVQALAANATLAEVRTSAVRSYARWQRLSLPAARRIFLP